MSSNQNSDFSRDIHLWAYTNFQLQTLLCQNSFPPNDSIDKYLTRVGYEGVHFNELSDKQKQELMKEDAFFGPFLTGTRIVTFALKKSGLNKELLNYIQESIDSAYEAVVQENGNYRLIDESYSYTLQTLSVFRP